MNQENFAVVIPSFNRREVTKNCVAGLLKGSYSNVTIIICDSDSTDGTREAFVGQPNVSVINVGGDCWWTGAVNKGLEVILKKNYEFALLINDDIDMPPQLIESLLEKARLNPGKIISPAQRSSQGVFLGINYSGMFKTPITTWVSREKEQVGVESSNGCCLLIPTETLRIIGLFDEAHCPHLYGDTEFQVRAWNHGLGTIAFSDVAISQHENTDYFRNLRLQSLLSYKGSPVHFYAYLTFGRTLFQGWIRFVFFGIKHHHLYLRSLMKAVYVIFRQDISTILKIKR